MIDVEWVAEYRATRARITELTRHLDQQAAQTRVQACPAWTVHDVLAHMVGIGAALSRRELPTGNNQEWIDGLVAARRDATVAQLLDEWRDAADGVDAFVDRMGPGGYRLVFDVVTHEHEIRHALGRPGARDSTGVRACVVAASTSLAGDLASAGLPAIRLTSDGRTWDVGDGEPQLATALEPFELIRAFGGRRSEAQLRALPWSGDLERYLPHLAHYPMPLADLVE